MRVITSGNFTTPYPDACPDWCKEGALVKTTVKQKSPLIGVYDDLTTYEIVSVSHFDGDDAKGIWGVAYMRPQGTDGRWTKAEYICDLVPAEDNEKVTGA